jgi:hypothetical protein
MRANENHLAFVFVVISTAAIAFLVSYLPEIGIAPLESMGQRLLRLALFTFYWPLVIFFFGGWDFDIVKTAREGGNLTFLAILLAAIIMGAAMVLGK